MMNQKRINVFIPHRWNNNDYPIISDLLDRTKFSVRDYSVPEDKAFEQIDYRYNVDPKIQTKIRYASIIVCSNRPAIGKGMSLDEIKFALDMQKTVVAVKVTENTSQEIRDLGIAVVARRKDTLEKWILDSCKGKNIEPRQRPSKWNLQ